MIYNKDYFTKGEVEGALIVEEKANGVIVDTRSYVGEREGEFVLTLSWDGGRESKTFSTFAQAMRTANGYWSRQSIWHITPNGRKRVIRWQ